ncbi:IL21 protein, partial [Rhinopomastus cyanomelas]|nr:IL21 protein [Rhinopomastus cyanomelas]
MEGMMIFCLLLFCSSMALTAAPYRTAKYQQLLKTIDRLESTVKNKDAELLHTPEHPADGCLAAAVTCFKKGILKLRPDSSQANPTFTQTVRVFRGFTFKHPGEQCQSVCESYQKKTPKEFLKSFKNLIMKVIR